MTRTLQSFLVPVLALLAGCSAAPSEQLGTGESNLNEATAPRLGSTIASPSVTASAKYWGARDISRLKRIGAVTELEASVAARADGIIANSPSNGMLGVDELAALESPQHSSSLFPNEKAAIPKLWSLLRIDSAQNIAVPALANALNVVESIPNQKTRIPATTLTAQRVELTCDEDGNATTLSSDDLECAYADRGSYTPAEVDEFRGLLQAIAEAGKAPERRISTPAFVQTPLFQTADVTLDFTVDRLVGEGWLRGAPLVTPELTNAARFILTFGGDVHVVTLDLDTGVEREEAGGDGGMVIEENQKLRVEVWKGGGRVAQRNLTGPVHVNQPLPFGVSLSVGPQAWDLGFKDIGRGVMGSYNASPVASRPSIPPRVYRVAGTTQRFELYPSGYGRHVTGSGKSTCYPVIVRHPEVMRCDLLDSAGQVTATIDLSPPSDGSLGSATLTRHASGNVSLLYPL